nr:DUF3144 domain-containing protein [Asticcacaulis aquaticus]
MAAEYIDIANRQGKEVDSFNVPGNALLHAAARYQAFVAATSSHDKTQMMVARKVNIDAITAQFREYLEGHYAEYSEHFDAYLSPQT